MSSEFAERAVPWVASIALLLSGRSAASLFNVPVFVLPPPTGHHRGAGGVGRSDLAARQPYFGHHDSSALGSP